ncbi:hypothetical protein [Streptomyces justiciae]|uniref:hypothetical protein n=1 Tax=Streptomyces justiciae TaxID=2780140 RepID=UPI0028D61FFE|nr:hypothetical protein [Streptomyces justiciae]
MSLFNDVVVLVREFEAVLPAETGKERGQVVDPLRVNHAVDQGCPVAGLIEAKREAARAGAMPPSRMPQMLFATSARVASSGRSLFLSVGVPACVSIGCAESWLSEDSDPEEFA